MKRPCRIDHDIRGQRPQRGQIGGAVLHQMVNPQLCSQPDQRRSAAPDQHHLMPVADQQPHQPFAENAGAANDSNLHPINRARNAGSGMAHMSARPKTA